MLSNKPINLSTYQPINSQWNSNLESHSWRRKLHPAAVFFSFGKLNEPRITYKPLTYQSPHLLIHHYTLV